MQRQWIYFLLGACFACQGCGLPMQATHVLTYRTKQAWNDRHERKRNRKWAEQAWSRVCQKNPRACFSDDHAEGFRDGFADYLYHGGTGEAPVLPPKKYRTLKYQTPEGYRAIEQWYAGYRHGAGEAMQGGYRRWVTGPPPPGYAETTASVVYEVPESAPLVPIPQPMPVQPHPNVMPAPHEIPAPPVREVSASGLQPVGYVEPQPMPQPAPVPSPAPVNGGRFYRNAWQSWPPQK